MARKQLGAAPADPADGVTKAQLDAKSNRLATINPQVGTTYTFVLADIDGTVEAANAATITHTIPTDANVAFPTGTQIEVVQTGAGQITVVGDTGVTVVYAATAAKTRAQWSSLILRKRAANSWIVTGDMA